MTYAARPTELPRFAAPARPAAPCKAAARTGLLRRLYGAIFESRAQSADREAEAYLARTGYRFTDSIEREINERHVNGGWNARG